MWPPTNITHLICKSAHHTGSYRTAWVLLKPTFTFHSDIHIQQSPKHTIQAYWSILRYLSIAVQNQTIYTYIIREALRSYQHLLQLYIYKLMSTLANICFNVLILNV